MSKRDDEIRIAATFSLWLAFGTGMLALVWLPWFGAIGVAVLSLPVFLLLMSRLVEDSK